MAMAMTTTAVAAVLAAGLGMAAVGAARAEAQAGPAAPTAAEVSAAARETLLGMQATDGAARQAVRDMRAMNDWNARLTAQAAVLDGMPRADRVTVTLFKVTPRDADAAKPDRVEAAVADAGSVDVVASRLAAVGRVDRVATSAPVEMRQAADVTLTRGSADYVSATEVTKGEGGLSDVHKRLGKVSTGNSLALARMPGGGTVAYEAREARLVRFDTFEGGGQTVELPNVDQRSQRGFVDLVPGKVATFVSPALDGPAGTGSYVYAIETASD